MSATGVVGEAEEAAYRAIAGPATWPKDWVMLHFTVPAPNKGRTKSACLTEHSRAALFCRAVQHAAAQSSWAGLRRAGRRGLRRPLNIPLLHAKYGRRLDGWHMLLTLRAKKMHTQFVPPDLVWSADRTCLTFNVGHVPGLEADSGCRLLRCLCPAPMAAQLEMLRRLWTDA